MPQMKNRRGVKLQNCKTVNLKNYKIPKLRNRKMQNKKLQNCNLKFEIKKFGITTFEAVFPSIELQTFQNFKIGTVQFRSTKFEIEFQKLEFHNLKF